MAEQQIKVMNCAEGMVQLTDTDSSDDRGPQFLLPVNPLAIKLNETTKTTANRSKTMADMKQQH